MTDWTDEQIEALCQAATPGPWKLSEPQGNWIWPHICNTYGYRREDAQFIAAARELVPALYARACEAEAERDRQRARADHNANAVNENAAMIVRLRAELAEAKAENERLRQVAQSDRETAADYADEVAAAHAERDEWKREALGGRGAIAALSPERDALAAQVAAVRALHHADDGDLWCDACCFAWPCATIRVLDGTGQDEANCICPRFSDTGGFRIANLCCPVHGPEGTNPGDGYWDDEAAVSRPTEGDEQ